MVARYLWGAMIAEHINWQAIARPADDAQKRSVDIWYTVFSGCASAGLDSLWMLCSGGRFGGRLPMLKEKGK